MYWAKNEVEKYHMQRVRLRTFIRHHILAWFSFSFAAFQTQETAFHQISKPREERWKYDEQRSIYEELRGVWKSDETLSRVFDTSSQSKLKLRRKRKYEILKIMLINITFQNKVTVMIFYVLTGSIINKFDNERNNALFEL